MLFILIAFNVFCLINANKYNVLFVIIDDLRHLSEEEIILPNIKSFAEESVNFKNAFVQQALCAPSRNSLLTGRRPDTLHLYDFYSYWRDDVANFTSLPQFFKENGYDTHSLGKVFHPGQSSNFTDDFPYSWSHVPYHPPSDKYKDAAVCKDDVTSKFQANLICPVNIKEQPGKTLSDLETLDYANNLITKYNNSKPFFIAVGFHKPHIPLKFPRHYLDRIPLDKVKPQKHPFLPFNMPLVSSHPWTDVRKREDIARLNISFPLGIMPYEWAMKVRQSYYAAALYVDDLFGQLLKHVDRRNTIVVLTSDHGWSLGENGQWAKYSNFDVALKVPLIFSVPNNTPKIIKSAVELIDIFPTLADLADLGKEVPKCDHRQKSVLCFEGKSVKDLLIENENGMMTKYAFSQYPRPSSFPQENTDKPRLKDIKIMGYSIRTKRFRYTEWIKFNNKLFTVNWDKIYGIELYDHIIDPEESNNLHLNYTYKNIKKYLSGVLRSHVNNTL